MENEAVSQLQESDRESLRKLREVHTDLLRSENTGDITQLLPASQAETDVKGKES